MKLLLIQENNTIKRIEKQSGALSMLLVVLVTILFGCKKDKVDERIFPVDMYSQNAEVVSDTKVYTKNGQLNDPQKAAELMWIYTRNFRLEQELLGAGEKYLTFITKDSVSFYNSHSPYYIARSGDRLMMTSSIKSISPKPVLADQIYHFVAKHQNLLTEGDVEIRRDVRVAYGRGYEELKVPMFAYVTSSWIEGPVSGLNRRGGLVVNEFNEDVLKRLGDRDTIIFKTYMLNLKAK